ncbi:transposase [Lentilactobacillus hilgardii]|uniref:transposase n=1 Tax=Lentilactobacillus hilgardii TaxID=1588 RepID=UPI0035CF8149
MADINSLSQVNHIIRASITDCNGTIVLIAFNLEHFKLVRTILIDSGYMGQNFANEIRSLTSAKVSVVNKGNKLHPFSTIPQHWLIEHLFSYLGNYRCL